MVGFACAQPTLQAPPFEAGPGVPHFGSRRQRRQLDPVAPAQAGVAL